MFSHLVRFAVVSMVCAISLGGCVVRVEEPDPCDSDDCDTEDCTTSDEQHPEKKTSAFQLENGTADRDGLIWYDDEETGRCYVLDIRKRIEVPCPDPEN